MRGWVAAAVVLGALLVVPPALAGMDGMYRGSTTQGLKVYAEVTDTQLQLLNVPWRATDCRPDDDYVVKMRRFVWRNAGDGGIEMSGDHFSDRGKVTLGPKSRRVVVSAMMAGRFVGKERISGKQRISVQTDDKFGSHSCTASMKWSAKLVKR